MGYGMRSSDTDGGVCGSSDEVDALKRGDIPVSQVRQYLISVFFYLSITRFFLFILCQFIFKLIDDNDRQKNRGSIC
jgi:hypothetical protein